MSILNKTLRDYQVDLSKKAVDILKEKKIVYLQFSVRVGKTATALETCRLYGAKKVLFLTKKKAIGSIESDYKDFGFTFDLTVINNESLQKVTDNDFDIVIQDEAHSMGAFPKPSNRTKDFKLRFSRVPMILLSGTPSAESYSQWYHQFWLSAYNPFAQYKNFYQWSKTFVNVKQRQLGHGLINDYSDAKIDLIDAVIQPYILKFTQEESGFESKVNEHVIYYPTLCRNLIERLEKDLIIEGKENVILADTGAKLMQKVHQLESGTIKFECGKSMILNTRKAEFIRDYFEGKKLAILYYFVEEFELLKLVFPNFTTDLDEFNRTDKHYIGQQYASSMGINLSAAHSLVFYSFGYSGTHFLQAIDRLTTKERKKNDVYFVFGKGSLSERIYKVVSKKKNFTLKMYERTKDSK
jgi:hypothetical protein